MTSNQKNWSRARDQLAASVAALGYPEEFADLLAKQLKSPKAIDRMTAWLNLVHPRNIETIADEMLAICSEIDTWRERKESKEAQAGVDAWLRSKEREALSEEE